MILNDGEGVQTGPVDMRDARFSLPDGRVFPKNQVRDWWVAAPKTRGKPGHQAASTMGGKEHLSGLRAYRDQGRHLAKRFPGAPAILIVDDGDYTLTHDKRYVYTYHMVVLVLDESELDAGNISLGFTEGRSRAKIIEGRCLTADDTLLTLNPSSAEISTPASKGNVNFNPNARLLSATIPGVDVGSVVEVTYEFETYAPEDWRLFSPDYYFQGEWPVVESTFVIQVPADVKLYTWESNWRTPDEKKSTGGVWNWLKKRVAKSPRKFTTGKDADGHPVRRYQWRRHDMPPVTPEPNMPPRWQVVPAAHASLFKDWDYLNKLTGDMQRERIQLTPGIKKLADELTATDTTAAEKTATLYHWVQKNIRYISVKSSLSSGWAGHPASETLKQGYGDCTDKSILFCSLLKAVGVPAEPLILLTNDKGTFVPEYPALVANHCITDVHLPEKSIILDTTSQDYRYPAFRGDDHGAFVINFMRGTTGLSPVPEGMLGRGKDVRENMTITPDGTVEIRSRNTYAGDYEAGLRSGWKRVPEHIRGQIMRQFLNSIAPGANLVQFDIGKAEDLSTPFFLNYTYRLPEYVKTAGDLRILQLPAREKSFDELSVDKRVYPLIYQTSEATRRHVVITFPENWAPMELPADVTIQTPRLIYRESFSITDGQLVIDTFFERRVRKVLPEDYQPYLHTARDIEKCSRRFIYLKTNQ